MIQAMPLNVHAFSKLGERGETPWNPPGADSEAVGQRFEFFKTHHARLLESSVYEQGPDQAREYPLAKGPLEDRWSRPASPASQCCTISPFNPEARRSAVGRITTE
jgi:hypothetical protein